MYRTLGCSSGLQDHNKSARMMQNESLNRQNYIIQRFLDCLQSAFSLKIRLVLVSASAIANYDVMLQ